MTLKKGEQVELSISDLAYGGQGVARHNGFTVFVDQTAPSDHVLVQIIKKKQKFAIARLKQIIKPSPMRVTPPCAYSGYCGGCNWQFLAYDRQLFYKHQHVVEALKRIGKIETADVLEPIASDRIYGYRNKMEFSCSDSRWLLPEEMGLDGLDKTFALGLHVPGTFHKVLDTRACWLQPQLGNLILEEIRTYMKNSRTPLYGLRTHTGFWRYVMLRHSVAFDQWMVNLISAYEDLNTIEPLARRLQEKFPKIVSIVANINTSKAGIAVGDYEIPLRGTKVLKEKLGAYTFEISANSFFQTNSGGAERLYETVKRFADLTGSEMVVDLYSGTGAIAIFLAAAARQVIGIEMATTAVKDAERNCLNNHIDNCKFIMGDIRYTLARLPVRADLMIIDPPRTGMYPKVVSQVRHMSPRRIIYVSCNPASLARDLGLLKEDFRVLEVQPVDMFPHTYHIEAVVHLERK